MITIQEINEFSKAQFVARIGWVYKDTPWVAEKAWEFRPFASVQFLHRAMTKVVDVSLKEDKLALIQAHPDIENALNMSLSSKQDQLKSVFGKLTPKEFKRFVALNNRYVKKYGFPFVLAVRGHDKHSIYDTIKRRIKNTEEQELEAALEELNKISFFKLREFITKEGSYQIENETLPNHIEEVNVYRTNTKPIIELKKIGEPAVTNLDYSLAGWHIKIEFNGKNLPARKTATSEQCEFNSIGIILQEQFKGYEGTNIEGFLADVVSIIHEKFPDWYLIKVKATEVPLIPANELLHLKESKQSLIFTHVQNKKSTAEILSSINDGEQFKIIDSNSGIEDLQLIKIINPPFESSTQNQDQKSVTCELVAVRITVKWRYQNPTNTKGDLSHFYVSSEQVKDLCIVLFNNVNLVDVQDLAYIICVKTLERFPQLKEVAANIDEDIFNTFKLSNLDEHVNFKNYSSILNRDDLIRQARQAK